MVDCRLDFGIFSKFRGELMGIAILGVCLLHGFSWANISETAIGHLTHIAAIRYVTP